MSQDNKINTHFESEFAQSGRWAVDSVVRTLNKPNKKTEEDDESMMFPPVMTPPVIINVNQNRQRVEVNIRGLFVRPEQVNSELTMLNKLADEYSTVLITINSHGGSADTMFEMMNILKRYKTVITVAAGSVSSAGFFLWCAGDVRVVQKYTMLMAHRESYAFSGKSDYHADYNKTTSIIGQRMVDDLCADILSTEEMDFIRRNELWLTDEHMIERGVCITWEQFVLAETSVPSTMMEIEFEGRNYIAMQDGRYMCKHTGQIYEWFEVQYKPKSFYDKEKESESAQIAIGKLFSAQMEEMKNAQKPKKTPSAKKPVAKLGCPRKSVK